MKGRSRSATIVAAFLMHYNQWTADQALSHIQQARSVVHPNAGFMQMLKDFEARIFTANPMNKQQSDTATEAVDCGAVEQKEDTVLQHAS